MSGPSHPNGPRVSVKLRTPTCSPEEHDLKVKRREEEEKKRKRIALFKMLVSAGVVAILGVIALKINHMV